MAFGRFGQSAMGVLGKFRQVIAPVVAAIAMVFGVAAPAHAWTLIDWNGGEVWGADWTSTTALTFNASSAMADSHPWFTIYFDGITDDYQNHLVPLPGLAATVTYSLSTVSTDKKKWTFDYEVYNASIAPVASRVSIVGFDVGPNMKSGVASGLFTKVKSGNVPMVGNREVCLTTGNNCSGGGNGGLTRGETGGGSFTLTFAAPTDTFTITNPFVRYQSLDFPGKNGSSGIGLPVAYVPEPAAWAMMLVGFFSIGGALRLQRRRATLAAV